MSQSSHSQQEAFPAQHQQHTPGIESEMVPQPIFDDPQVKGGQKLKNKVAIISGGDSGIGRAVATLFAKEGADVVISYLNEEADAQLTKQQVEHYGRQALAIAGDIGEEAICQSIVAQTMDRFGKIDILVNNAAYQQPQQSIAMITADQLEQTFRTNIYSYFYLTKAALLHLKKGSSIINTASIVAYRGSAQLLDYSATKGAVVSFTRSLSQSVIKQGIRVNGVAPGPIWTPLIPSTFPADQVATFGTNSPMKRAGQPVEVAPAYLFLASDDSAYMAGQIIHVNGGEVVNG